jgi:integrase
MRRNSTRRGATMAKPANIRKRGNSWVAYIRIEGVQRQSVQRQRSFKTKDDAELWIARVKVKKGEGQTDEFDREAIKKRRMLLRDFAKQKWLPHAQGRVRTRTLEGYEGTLRCHILPALGDYQLGALDRETLSQFFTDWSNGGPMFQERQELVRRLEQERWEREQQASRAAELQRAAREGRHPRIVDVPKRSIQLGTSRGTLQNGLTALRACLSLAVEWDYIPKNPARGLELPKEKGEQREMAVLTAEQVDRVLEAASAEARPVILTAVSTGVRRGELFALRWSDFDPERRRLWVRRSLDRHGDFNEPKTKGSKRAIACRPTLVQALREHRMATRFSDDDDLIFPNVKGGPMDAGNFVRREFRPALRRAGGQMVRFHDLRHTFVSLLIADGLSPKRISALCGHSSISITMDRYGHLFDDSETSTSDAIEHAFELPDAEEAETAASGPPASASAGRQAPAVSTQPAPVIRLESRVSAAGGGTA